jgi:hypothetical protein
MNVHSDPILFWISQMELLFVADQGVTMIERTILLKEDNKHRRKGY